MSLAPSQYNGYHVSCFGKRDGAINLTVTGGLPPYSYNWSTGDTLEDINNLSAGYYQVSVVDRNGIGVEASLTLTEPEPLSLDFLVSTYPNGFNVSCFNCFNGTILTYISGGAGNYNYTWEDGPATSDRFNLGQGSYTLTISDGNLCLLRPERFYLTEPERSDWTLNGNQGNIDTNRFIGTTDSSSLLIKSNNNTLLRLKPDGQLGFPRTPPGMLYLDESGNLQSASSVYLAPCIPPQPGIPIWQSLLNGPLYSCPAYQVGIGTYTIPTGIRLRVDGTTWLDGRVGIGLNPDAATLQSGATPYQLFVNGKMGATEIYCSAGTPWPDYVFSEGYQLKSLSELREYITLHKHLPGVPSAAEVQQSGINVYGQLAKAYEKIEELYLYIFNIEQRIKELEKHE